MALTGQEKLGYEMLRFCGKQAGQDGLQCFWVDTYCIDKENYVELLHARLILPDPQELPTPNNGVMTSIAECSGLKTILAMERPCCSAVLSTSYRSQQLKLDLLFYFFCQDDDSRITTVLRSLILSRQSGAISDLGCEEEVQSSRQNTLLNANKYLDCAV
jgi:hypothetical protein